MRKVVGFLSCLGLLNPVISDAPVIALKVHMHGVRWFIYIHIIVYVGVLVYVGMQAMFLRFNCQGLHICSLRVCWSLEPFKLLQGFGFRVWGTYLLINTREIHPFLV